MILMEAKRVTQCWIKNGCLASAFFRLLKQLPSLRRRPLQDSYCLLPKCSRSHARKLQGYWKHLGTYIPYFCPSALSRSGVSALLYFVSLKWASFSVPNILLSCLSSVFLFLDHCSGHGCIYRPGHLPRYC